MIISTTNSSRDQHKENNNSSIEAKQEGNLNIDESCKYMSKGLQTAAASSSSTRQWSGFRNPRIVRVSRSFGGKDRHSKVCTVRGLRDRRIRLSVPTAIQLYDLQDRLGLSQPSKVIDWLLDATKHDIDKLPPLQLPPGFGGQFPHHHHHHQPLLFSQEPNSTSMVNINVSPHQSSSSLGVGVPFFDVNPMELDPSSMGGKRYGTAAAAVAAEEKGKWVKGSSTNDHDQHGDHDGKMLSFMDRRKDDDESGSVYHDGVGAAAASLPGLLNNGMPPPPFGSYYHWDPSSLSLSHFGNHGFLPSPQTENFLNGNNIMHSSNSLQSLPPAAAAPQLFFCPPSTVPSLFPTFPPYASTTPTAPAADSSSHESRQMMINHFQWLSSSNPQHNNNNNNYMLPNSAMAMKPPFSLNVNAGSHTQDDDESLADDDDDDDITDN